MVKCILCLEYPTIPGPKFLDLFSDEGVRLGISLIINKHFWLKTYRNGVEAQQQVCMTCWEIVRDFHILYQRVEEVHKHNLEIKTIDIDDPLPQDVVMLKSEDTPVPMMMLQDPIMSHSSLGDHHLFDSEVKVEVNDLDLLPQIEIIETAPDIAIASSSSSSNERTIKTRRSRLAAREQSPKTTTKRIKKESSPTLERDDDDVDVFADSEPPMADDIDNIDEVNKSFLSSSLDVEEPETSVTRSKRGRPRKTDAEKSKSSTPAASVKKTPAPRKRNTKKAQQAASIKNENAESEEPSCSTAQTAGVSQIKTEQSVDEQLKDKDKDSAEVSDTVATAGSAAAEGGDNFELNFGQDDDDDDDGDFGDNDNDYTAKDSDDSSGSESEEDNDSDASDWVADKSKSEKFAVILKKERNTPKKYKKREKPSVEPKRMSKEDIAARNAQQTEYDNIITKFFEKLRCPKCELLVHTFGDMRAHFRLDHNDDHGFVECCGRRFATRKYLAEHIMVHYNPEHFKCKTCDKVCRDSTQLETHEQTHLPNPPEAKYKKTFQCEKCSKTFSSKASFEHHMVAKHVPREEFKFECPECKKKCPTDRKLKDHMKSVHDPQRSVICDKCGKTLKSGYSLKKHHDIEHSDKPKPVPIPQQCEICGAWLRHVAGLKQHMKNIHESVETEHRCHICNKVSSTARALKRHIYHNHECAKKFQCTMCEKAFKRAQDLREHTSVHTGEVLYTCPNCPMTFFSNANMYKHRQRLHRAEWEADRSKPIPPNIMKQAKQGSKVVKVKRSIDSDDNKHLVPLMPMIPTPMANHPHLLNPPLNISYSMALWPSKAKLRKHMNSHDISRQKICDQCGKTFRCNTSMRKHVDAEHSEVKPEPQQCTICNTWYRNLSGLRTHMKFMHENLSGENRCHICNKVSTNHRALRRHIYLNHECEKKFKCHMCEKAFKREQDLREHISVHTGEALYTCPNCPMTFSSSANMYKHRQRLHKAEYAAHKQQPMAVNIIKQAKSMPNTIRTKRRMVGDSQDSLHDTSPMVPPPPPLNPAFVSANHLISPHFLVGSHFGTHNLSKLTE